MNGSKQLQDATDLIISKIKEAEENVDEYVGNLNSLSKAGSEYESFGGISDGMKGKTKFIIRIDGIGEEKQ